ncbi:MAG TPA: long-chain fatty acid--CoA ligase [Desulfomonilia bacterium]
MAKYQETSMAAIFQNRVEKWGDKAMCAYKNDKGVYEDISWNQMNKMVLDLAAYLLTRGVNIQDKVGLFSPNRYEWWVSDLAILTTGAVNVPIYPTNSAEESRYVIDNSDSKICIVGTKSHMQKILEVKPQLPNLTDIIILDDLDTPVEGVVTFKEALRIGAAANKKDELDKRINSIKTDDIATLIYTSGTTGNPKGVMLTHNNFVSNCNQCYDVAPHLFEFEHTLLSFLPLSHSLERTVGYYLPLYTGKKVVFAGDVSKILEYFQEVRPTFIVSVPRIYEKVHSGVVSKVGAEKPLKQKIFAWAMDVAKRNLPYICNDKPRTGLFAIEYAIANKIIFSKLKARLGLDRLQFALSGGGPLSVSDAEFFLGMDVKVLEGFGLTETTPVTNANKPEKIKPGTVGPPLRDTIVKISEEGEILIKGPQVMKGYYKNEAATKEVFTDDGFFKTGDIGVIDSDNYLKITGRIKDLIITSGGKNISPQNIENSLKTSPYIEQVAVIGDNRKYLSALIVPVFTELENWAKANNIAYTSKKDLIDNPEVNKLILSEVEANMKDYARVEQIRKIKLLENEWSQQTDELTPTLKIKRRVINQKYAAEIESLYPPDTDV